MALVIIAVLVSIAIVVPLVFLLVQAGQVGWASLDRLLFRHLTGTLLWNTVSLTVVVTALAAAIGTVSAWFIERTKLPGRSFWAVAVVIPWASPTSWSASAGTPSSRPWPASGPPCSS